MSLLLSGSAVVGHTQADSILIDGETISAVGAKADLRARATEELDVGDLWLSPGFVDTHVHMTGNGTPSAPVDIHRAPDDLLLLQGADNARRALAEGITTMRDCGALNRVIFPLRDAANGGVIVSPNLLACGGALTRTGGHGHWWGLEADSIDEVRKAVRAQSRAGADSLKVMVDGGIDLGRHTPGLLYFDSEVLGIVVEEARDWGMPVAAHCLTAAGVRAAVDAGVTSVEHAIFFELDLDDTRYDEEVGAAMRDRGIYASPGPAFAYDILTDPDAQTTFPRNARLFNRRLEDDARLHEQGVKLVASTDAGWYATPFGQFARVADLFVTEVGMSPAEAFAACTIVSAESMGIDDVAGSLDVGKRADVVVLDGDPTVDVHAMRTVRTTMVRGRVVHDTGLTSGYGSVDADAPHRGLVRG